MKDVSNSEMALNLSSKATYSCNDVSLSQRAMLVTLVQAHNISSVESWEQIRN